MDDCLQIPEISRMICSELLDGTKLGRSSLSALAQTCRTLEMPALDVLWYEQESLVPVMKTFPSDLWEIRIDARWNLKTLHFVRPMVTKDWSRFLIYSSRIVSLHSDICNHVDPSIFHILEIAKPPALRLLPKIRVLDWGAVDDDAFVHIPRLLGPTVVDFSFSLRGDTNIRMSLLPSLYGLCPSLKTLTILYDYDQVTVDAVSEHICGWETLEEVKVGLLDAVAFTHLAAMCTLRRLSFLWNTMDSILVSSTLKDHAFPVLETLSLEAGHASVLQRILSLSVECPLTDISLELTNTSSAQTWTECFQALPTHVSHNTLTSVFILEYNDLPQFQADDTHIVEGNLLRSLHVFTNLTKFSLHLASPMELDDAMLKDMAKAWPHLRELKLGSHYALGGLSKVTLAGLIPLMEYCPYLATLGIIVDATSMTALSLSKPGAGVSNSVLETLHVADSRISQDVSNIAAFLSDFMPNLSTILSFYEEETTDDDEAAEYEDRWESVQKLIPVFAKVRQQERLFERSQNC